MAGSQLTKKALADALKALMAEQAFDKISINDICDRCGSGSPHLFFMHMSYWEIA